MIPSSQVAQKSSDFWATALFASTRITQLGQFWDSSRTLSQRGTAASAAVRWKDIEDFVVTR